MPQIVKISHSDVETCAGRTGVFFKMKPDLGAVGVIREEHMQVCDRPDALRALPTKYRRDRHDNGKLGPRILYTSSPFRS